LTPPRLRRPRPGASRRRTTQAAPLATPLPRSPRSRHSPISARSLSASPYAFPCCPFPRCPFPMPARPAGALSGRRAHGFPEIAHRSCYRVTVDRRLTHRGRRPRSSSRPKWQNAAACGRRCPGGIGSIPASAALSYALGRNNQTNPKAAGFLAFSTCPRMSEPAPSVRQPGTAIPARAPCGRARLGRAPGFPEIAHLHCYRVKVNRRLTPRGF